MGRHAAIKWLNDTQSFIAKPPTSHIIMTAIVLTHLISFSTSLKGVAEI